MNRLVKYEQGGIQFCMFPMETLNISQGINQGVSHKGRLAWDIAGKDTKIESAFAPCDVRIVWKKQNGSKTGILVENVKRIFIPEENGLGRIVEPQGWNMELWHDNNTSDLWVDKIIKQGVRFYEEGTADNAQGNHIHIMCSLTRYQGGYPLFKTIFNNWALKNQVDPIRCFFFDDTVIKNARGYDLKYTRSVIYKPSETYHINDKVKVIGTKWANGKTIPQFVKTRTYTIFEIKNDKVLLVPVLSWIFAKDIVKI